MNEAQSQLETTAAAAAAQQQKGITSRQEVINDELWLVH